MSLIHGCISLLACGFPCLLTAVAVSQADPLSIASDNGWTFSDIKVFFVTAASTPSCHQVPQNLPSNETWLFKTTCLETRPEKGEKRGSRLPRALPYSLNKFCAFALMFKYEELCSPLGL